MIRYSILFLAFFLTLTSFSQDMPDISTDRPDQSESSATIPHKTFQIETGFVWQGDRTTVTDIRNLDFFNTLFRYGLMPNMELRLGVNYADAVISPVDGGPDTTLRGFVPLAVGTKIYVSEQKGAAPELSIIAMITIPGTGSQDFDNLKMASDLRFALGWSITERVSAGGNIGLQWNTIVPGTSGFYSAVLGISLLDWMNAFAEVYGWLPEGEMPDHRVDFGLTFPVRQNLQFDVSGGLGLSTLSPDYFVNAGIAWRIPQ